MEKEEQLLISEIFKVFVSAENKALVQKVSATSSDFVYLKDIEVQIKAGTEPFYFSQKPQTIENVLLERLNVPQTPIFGYLTNCWYKANEERSRYSNDQTSGLYKVSEESLEIIKNYLVLSLTTPEMFENCNFEIRHSLFPHCQTTGNASMEKAKQALHVISEIGDDSVVSEILTSLADDQNFFYSVGFLFALELRSVTVFHSESQPILELCIRLCSQPIFKRFMIENFRACVINSGQDLEVKPLISVFFAKSILPFSHDPLIKEYELKVVDRVKSCKTKNAYLKTCEVN